MRITVGILAAPLLLACLIGQVRAEEETPPAEAATEAPLPAESPAAAPQAPTAADETAVAITVPTSETEAPPPRTAARHDAWERIRNGFALSDFDSALVREAEAWYTERPDYVRRMVERSRRYLFHVLEEVEKRGMPTEIALLPMIESAYNPMARSPAQAVGMWQFIPATGTKYGLKQNWWYDGRRDVVAATDAALDYLQTLYDMFNDWELALAAYNWGEGAVARALFRNQARGLPVDYHSLTLPAETRAYIPKLMAVKNIVRNPDAYGLDLESVPNRPYFETVTTDRHMDVKVAARLAEIPVEEFVALNAAHSRPVIPAGEPQTLLLPVEKVATFLGNLDGHDKPLATWRIYDVKPGERLERVAARFKISVARLKEINGIPARSTVRVSTLLVPARSGADEDDLDTDRFVAPAVVQPKAAKKFAKKTAKSVKKTAAKPAGKAKAAARRGPPKPVILVDARRRAR